MKYIQPWKEYFPPFRIFGNLFFVGTQAASTHIINTGEGLIMLDSGYQHSLYSVVDGMYSLGLDVHNLKYIVHTQDTLSIRSIKMHVKRTVSQRCSVCF